MLQLNSTTPFVDTDAYVASSDVSLVGYICTHVCLIYVLQRDFSLTNSSAEEATSSAANEPANHPSQATDVWVPAVQELQVVSGVYSMLEAVHSADPRGGL